MRTLIIRADANTEIGTGHVMRCLALAQAWNDAGGKTMFAMAAADSLLEYRIGAESGSVLRISTDAGSAADAEQTRNLVSRHGAEWLALDGYHFQPEYRRNLQLDQCRLLTVDDHAQFSPYDCDLLVNVNVYASLAMYPELPVSRALAGPKFALVREEFLGSNNVARVPSSARRLLITFGGGDPHNVSLQVLNALAQLNQPDLDVVVVAGSSNPNLARLEARAAELPFAARVLSNVTNMAELMDWADLGISAGGGTCFELAVRKVPMFLIIMASNHEKTVETFAEKGAAVNAGWFHSLDLAQLAASLQRIISDGALRSRMIESASSLVDGKGARRVVEAMHATDHS